ncbi:MAG: tRNA pseudouridine(55) synthase TruB [Terriglobia bacterium]
MSHGALVINKTRGLTSHDVVASVRRLFRTRSVGHLGTLDPIATGVLPLLVGSATRLQRFYQGRRKRYAGTIRFGFATDTYDSDGKPLGPDTLPTLERTVLEPLFQELVGKIQQVPPPYSAKKIGGVAAYVLARKKKKFTLAPIEAQVYRFELEGVEGSRAGFEIECAAGTYIRTLAHDLGQRLGTGAHLVEICRTTAGEFTLEQALTLKELEKVLQSGERERVLIPLERLLPDLPRAVVATPLERRLRHGGKVELSETQIEPPELLSPIDSREWSPYRLRVFNQERKLIAIAQAVVPRIFQPIVVLPAPA